VKLLTQAYQIPLLGDSGSVRDVMEIALQSCPKFQEDTEFGLGE